jgi:hypothetical protein
MAHDPFFTDVVSSHTGPDFVDRRAFTRVEVRGEPHG